MKTIGNQKGFGLLEAAMIITAGAGLAAVLISKTYQTFSDNEQKLMQRRLDKASHQLKTFAALQGRLPCPDTTFDGLENCATSAGKGQLPYRTLGMQTRTYRSGETPLLYGVYRRAVDTPASADIMAYLDSAGVYSLVLQIDRVLQAKAGEMNDTFSDQSVLASAKPPKLSDFESSGTAAKDLVELANLGNGTGDSAKAREFARHWLAEAQQWLDEFRRLPAASVVFAEINALDKFLDTTLPDEPLWSDLDLATSKNRYEPYNADSGHYAANQNNALDLCWALERANLPANVFNANYLHSIDQQGQKQHQAYILADPGAGDFDLATGTYAVVFDGHNQQAAMAFNAPEFLRGDDYDDLTLSVSFQELGAHLRCKAVLASLNMFAEAVNVENEIESQSLALFENIKSARDSAVVGTFMSLLNTGLAGQQVLSSNTQIGKAAAASGPPLFLGLAALPLAQIGLGLSVAQTASALSAMIIHAIAWDQYNKLKASLATMFTDTAPTEIGGQNVNLDMEAQYQTMVTDAQNRFNETVREHLAAKAAADNAFAALTDNTNGPWADILAAMDPNNPDHATAKVKLTEAIDPATYRQSFLDSQDSADAGDNACAQSLNMPTFDPNNPPAGDPNAELTAPTETTPPDSSSIPMSDACANPQPVAAPDNPAIILFDEAKALTEMVPAIDSQTGQAILDQAGQPVMVSCTDSPQPTGCELYNAIFDLQGPRFTIDGKEDTEALNYRNMIALYQKAWSLEKAMNNAQEDWDKAKVEQANYQVCKAKTPGDFFYKPDRAGSDKCEPIQASQAPNALSVSGASESLLKQADVKGLVE
ncbi:MAG: hypothetical protein RQ715_10920 [Methylococcales bacterium]|nr:hypothetical protein [Methylococcales bacterium]